MADYIDDYSKYEDPSEKPLFGESTPRDRVVNLVVGAFTALLVIETLVSAIAKPPWPPHGANILISCCILLVLISHLVLIYWYRQGDLEPRFRKLVYYNAFTIIMLCICANVFIFKGCNFK